MRPVPATLRLAPCLLAAAVCLLLDVRPAAASCGEYVHVRTAGKQASPARDQSPPADSPCAHGRCEKAPLAPAAPEPTAPTGGDAQDAALTAGDGPPALPGAGFAADPAGEPSHRPSVPFHPPRS